MARKRKRRRKQSVRKPVQPVPVKRRFSTTALTVLMVVALGLGAWFAISPTLEKEQALSEQQRILAEYEAHDTQPEPTASVPAVPAAVPTPTPAPEPLVVFEAPLTPDPEPTPRPIPENSGDRAIGALEVGRIGLKLPVVEGIDAAQLDVAIGHISETAPIGEVGNAVLAAHRSYAYGKFFNRLGELKIGDELTYTDAEGQSYKFSVYEVLELLPDDQSAFEPYTEKSVLSLYTCTPIRTATHRLVVRALRTE